MLSKNTIIHILDASDKILFTSDDADTIRFILENSSEAQVNRCYQAYLEEIRRQCHH